MKGLLVILAFVAYASAKNIPTTLDAPVCEDFFGGKCLNETQTCDGTLVIAEGIQICPGPNDICCVSGLAQKDAKPKAVECGVGSVNPDDRPESQIVGGRASVPGSWPWQVSVRPFFGLSHSCGGVLINDQWVLSAGHCFMQFDDPFFYQIVAGEHDFSETSGNEVSLEVEEIIIHPNYRGEQANDPNDIALVKLAQKVEFGDYINRVCLPEGDELDKDFAGDECWATGWGLTKGEQDQGVMQEVKSTVESNEDCNDAWQGVTVDDKMICFGDGRKGACQGDSGGPMVVRREGSDQFVLVGVTSWGSATCTVVGLPSVYTRVTDYVDWINRTIELN